MARCACGCLKGRPRPGGRARLQLPCHARLAPRPSPPPVCVVLYLQALGGRAGEGLGVWTVSDVQLLARGQRPYTRPWRYLVYRAVAPAPGRPGEDVCLGGLGPPPQQRHASCIPRVYEAQVNWTGVVAMCACVRACENVRDRLTPARDHGEPRIHSRS